ncbi:MAG: DUF2029 domain-containing protein [Candidatus Omnitrophica bacterium]|nr:DUF2029 domain-containing protein [Candidatus Omnitrophota bacterium]
MNKIELGKKLFNNVFVFIAVFLILSTAANLFYLDKNTSGNPGSKGWDGYPDFRVFWRAAGNFNRFFLDSQKNDILQYPIYNRNSKFYHFRYSPTIALFMVPFGKIPYPKSALFWWSLLSTLALLAAFLLMRRLIFRDFDLSDTKRSIVLWGTSLATLRYYLMILGQGQTDAIIAFFWVLFLVAYLKNNEIACGIMIALIIQIKPFFLPVLLYFLLRGKIKLIISTVIAFAGFLLLPCIAIGWDATIALLGEWKEILSMSIPSQLFNFKNQSVPSVTGALLLKNGAIRGLIAPQNLIYSISAMLTLCTYAMVIWISKISGAKNGNKCKYFEVSALVMASLVFSPIAWEAYFVNLLIPFAFTALLILQSNKRNALYAALAVYFVLSCVVGTDITKFIPGVNSFHFINISLGTIALAFAMMRSYRQTS